MNKLSSFNKQCLFECYTLMKDCVNPEHIEDEDFICSAFSKIEGYKIVLPTDIYNQMNNFIRENLYPITDDPDFFSSTHLPEFGAFDEEKGSFVVNSEESLKKIMVNFFQLSIDLERKIDGFAMKHLRPYLI